MTKSVANSLDILKVGKYDRSMILSEKLSQMEITLNATMNVTSSPSFRLLTLTAFRERPWPKRPKKKLKPSSIRLNKTRSLTLEILSKISETSLTH